MKRTAIITTLVTFLSLSVATGVASAGDHGDGHGGGHGGHDSGGGSEHMETSPTVPGAREIAVGAKSFAFMPKKITVAAGEDVTIVLRSKDILHDFVVKDQGHIVAAKARKTKRGGLRIDEPGTYRFWCSVTGHRSAGMKGTIVVQ
jgi:plastocyanin